MPEIINKHEIIIIFIFLNSFDRIIKPLFLILMIINIICIYLLISMFLYEKERF